MLTPIKNINRFREKFFNKLSMLRNNNPSFSEFLTNITSENTGYVIGGFLRDIVNDKESRDIDIVFDIEQEQLLKLIKSFGLTYKVNRMSGVKISLNNFESDIWTIKNNWAFKNKVVKQNDTYILECLADGCFYNYDSLVINMNKGSMSVKNYNNFVNLNQLDILRKVDVYKKRNPTLEANILRALYIKKLYDVKLSNNCLNYLAKTILELNNNFDDPAYRINIVKSKYEKYSKLLTNQEINDQVTQLCYDYGISKLKDIDKNQTSLYL